MGWQVYINSKTRICRREIEIPHIEGVIGI